MIKNKLLLLLSITLILVIVPTAFGADNDTCGLQTDLNDTAVSGDIYFDSNASNDHGEGTPDSPYQQLRDGRILDNSVIYLKNGEYEFNQLNSHSNISIIGQDAQKTIINGDGGILIVNKQLKLTNVTICNINIFNQGNLFASNTIFANSSAVKTGEYGDSYGGAIYCVEGSNNAYLTNCTFINNFADYGGAVYLNGGILEISDCIFINNTAEYYGGAIACDSKNSKPRVSIKRTKFTNDYSINDAGGAVYIKSATFTASDLDISSCNSTFGGALALLKTSADLSNIYAFNNTAKYEGGAIYQIYGTLTLINSSFISNHAKNGAGLYVDNADNVNLSDIHFADNSALQLAGGFYSLINENMVLNNVTYLNNTAFDYNDFFNQTNISLIFKNDNYSLINSTVSGGTIPKYYLSPLTPVKNQKNGGNCWAFATLAALESSILKATGEIIDLSEGNMKNLASIYSHYGWQMDTNQGGYGGMGFGYLTSWMGPILESDDVYNALNTLSPILDSIVHVQNIMFLKRSGPTDLDSIKRAIMDYGAVYSAIYMIAHYDSKSRAYVQYFTGSAACDHAVVLVGWDDNFQVSGAPGRGAWIAKNSWGDTWGNNGYFYVSYYDKSCPKIGENEGAFAFIFNDTIKYDKNYQYDIAKTDYFFNTAKTVWYKNIFTATDNEYLAAVSTYFEKATDYVLSIYVNDALKLTQSGKSPAGYWTFDLDEFVPLNVGDIFEVVFKITVNGDVGVPISEIISLNNYFYHENISYISYDGKNWKDLFNLEWTYPDHVYNSQVACIKAFTILNPINTTLTLAIENRDSTTADIVAYVVNQWGYPVNRGSVDFRFGEDTFSVELVNGIARKTVALKSANLTANFNHFGFVQSNSSVEIVNPLISTNITLNVSGIHNPINITARVVDENNVSVTSGSVDFIIDGRTYTVKVVNGTARLENINVTPSEFNISASYTDLFYYGSSYAIALCNVSRINTKISMNITSSDANNPLNITAHVLDEDNKTVKCGYVVFRSWDREVIVDVVDGVANCIYTFTETGGNVISASYIDEYIYNRSGCNEYLIVSKMKVNLTLSVIFNECNAIFGISIKNPLSGFRIVMYVNGHRYKASSTDGAVIFELNDNDAGTYNYTIELESSIYEADNLTGQFNITYQKTQLIANYASLYYNGNYSVELKDKDGNIIPDRDVYLTVNGITFKSRTNAQGIAIFNLPISSGRYTASINFIGDDEYVKSKASATINIKSTIGFVSNKYATNSKYMATFYDSNGNLLVNKDVDVVLNGVNHKLKTDNNGQISLDINLKSGSYIVKLTNRDSGEVKTQTISVVDRIVANKPVTMYYGGGKSYKVRVCDDYGKYSEGLKVTFKVNGKSYTRTTDSDGYASFKISLLPGKYTITAEYKGFKVSNRITVKTTLITKNISVKKGKTIKFTAKLLDSKGKILKNKKVTFKFKGKTYRIKTNKKGIAILKITKKYKRGKYAIKTSYGKLKIKNSIKIR